MPELTEIFNFIQIDDMLGTAGQPKPEQMPLIKENGYKVVINLASGETEHDVPNEGELIKDLDLIYHHLPIDWENPTINDLRKFFDIMQAHQEQKVFVHCIANYRVTGFTMLYRVLRQGVALDDAQATLHKIWNPEEFPIWQAFIKQALEDNSLKDNS